MKRYRRLVILHGGAANYPSPPDDQILVLASDHSAALLAAEAREARLREALVDCLDAMKRYNKDYDETTTEEWDGSIERGVAIIAALAAVEPKA